MGVEPQKPRKILVVHGVQTGRDEDINSHETIRELIINRLNGIPIRFETDIYKYENINDKAQKKLKKILDFFLKRLTDKVPFGKLLGSVVDSGVDLVGDVVIKLKEDSTAMTIRNGLIKKIEKIYNEGNPLYIVAHSLGSIYAFDAVNQLIKDNRYFDRTSRRTWPVQGLITLGSPIGLSMFKRNTVKNLGVGTKYFRWINYWARTDPVVSGNFYGKPHEGYQIAEKFTTDSEKSGWLIQDRVVETGKAWLMAHVGYWDNAAIGDDLVTLIAN
ncbi:hypothetical protein KAW48_09485 [candidate division WOR-3 bacterium]|nr:hypothetical protein [candidate division WOR-3 bacterium]